MLLLKTGVNHHHHRHLSNVLKSIIDMTVTATLKIMIVNVLLAIRGSGVSLRMRKHASKVLQSFTFPTSM
jgi:hypothetical protein